MSGLGTARRATRAGRSVAERVSRGGAIVLEIIGSVEHNALGVGPN